jgi:hypothetical protein
MVDLGEWVRSKVVRGERGEVTEGTIREYILSGVMDGTGSRCWKRNVKD